MVCYNGTIRNLLGDLIQFVYGEARTVWMAHLSSKKTLIHSA